VIVTDLPHLVSEEARQIMRDAGANVLDADSFDSEQRQRAIDSADALLVVWFDANAQVIDRLERCKIIIRAGIGHDNIDSAAAARRGIPVCNVPDYCVDEVADHAMSLALTLARRIPQLDSSVRAGEWTNQIVIPAFQDMTFGIVGLGRTGKAVARRAHGFGFNVAACDPYIPTSDFESSGAQALDLETMLARADILSVHTPLNEETRGLIGEQQLLKMKPEAIVVNTARGPIVDTIALAAALNDGRLAGAGIDVFETEPLPADHPIRSSPNAVLTPHYAWHSARSKRLLWIRTAEEIVRALKDEPLRSCVNGVQPSRA
jgi:D-3-phosphoglycerate dehydrogenase